MVLSQRSRYGVRAVLELAKREDGFPVKAAAIAAAQNVPVRFLENILAQLRQGGVVESVRGKDGGYLLRRPSSEVTVGEVVRLFEGQIGDVDCRDAASGRDCSLKPGCVLLPLWTEAHGAMMAVFDHTTFEQLVERDEASGACLVPEYVI